MKSKWLIVLGIGLVTAITLASLGAWAVFAQGSTPNAPFGPGGMMGGVSGMGVMHARMNGNNNMHTWVWSALAESFGLSTNELDAELSSGKTLAALAEEKGLDRATLLTAVENTHQAALAQAVSDGTLTQEQADAMLNQMSGRYEWMIDNMGSGAGMMGGRRGGMMGGGYGRQGGCQGNFNSGSAQVTP